MGLFDKKSSEVGFPQKNSNISPAFPEPPESFDDFDDLDNVKSSIESDSMPEPMGMDNELEDNLDYSEPKSSMQKMPESLGQKKEFASNPNPVLYIKISEYKEVVEAANKMRKDIEKAKNIVGDLRMIEKDEHSKLEKSEEVIREIEDIISLFEKVMVTPVE